MVIHQNKNKIQVTDLDFLIQHREVRKNTLSYLYAVKFVCDSWHFILHKYDEASLKVAQKTATWSLDSILQNELIILMGSPTLLSHKIDLYNIDMSLSIWNLRAYEIKIVYNESNCITKIWLVTMIPINCMQRFATSLNLKIHSILILKKNLWRCDLENSDKKVWLIAHGSISAQSNYWKGVTYATWAT